MKLFSRLSEIMGDGCTLTINIAKTEMGMTVSVLPGNSLVKDAAKTKIVPLNIKGTASELDEGFVDAISGPVAKTNGLYADIKSFEDAQQAAKEASEMEKKAKEKTKKDTEMFAKWMALAEQNHKENKFKDATTCAKNALEYADTVKGGHAKADALIKKISEDMNAGLFGAVEDKSDGKNIKVGKKAPAAANAEEAEEDDTEE